MAKERTDEERALRKKEKKKEKKLAETNGVVKSSKKDKKSKRDSLAAATDAETDVDTTLGVDGMDVDGEGLVTKGALLAQIVPIAHPLADDKLEKKVLKGVKRGTTARNSLPAIFLMLTIGNLATKHKALKRGVKEVVKALRKSPGAGQGVDGKKTGVVVIAADISPLDVISHLPVLCEDHDVPYIWVPSRQSLGEAGNTKRPTSVVMMAPNRGKTLKRDDKGKVLGEEKGGKAEEDAKDQEWSEQYDEVVKAVVKAAKGSNK